MGIEYRPVAGFTIRITEDLRQRIYQAAEKIMEGEDNDEIDLEAALGILNINYATVGSSWTGEEEVVPLFTPVTAVNLDKQISDWLSDFNSKVGVKLEVKDIIFFKDLLLW